MEWKSAVFIFVNEAAFKVSDFLILCVVHLRDRRRVRLNVVNQDQDQDLRAARLSFLLSVRSL